MPVANDDDPIKPRKCPECGALMEFGQVRTRSDSIDLLGMNSVLESCWFFSIHGKEWLVVPGGDIKQAHRCESCGTTLILRDR